MEIKGMIQESNIWKKVVAILVVAVVAMVLFYSMPVYAYGACDNCCDSAIGYYGGGASSLGGSWGVTPRALKSGDIVFCDKTVLITGGEFHGRWFPHGGFGYDSLNPYAKDAADVVGYGSKPYKPSVYLTSTSRNIAFTLGYGDPNIPVLYPW